MTIVIIIAEATSRLGYRLRKWINGFFLVFCVDYVHNETFCTFYAIFKISRLSFSLKVDWQNKLFLIRRKAKKRADVCINETVYLLVYFVHTADFNG